MLATPGMASEDSFVFIPQADSPGNDYLRVDNSSFEDCARRCDAQNACNAFTYNQRHGICFLKHSANTATTFYAFAITGVKRAPSGPATAMRNQARTVCFLKRAASQWTTFFAWATTGIKLSRAEEKTASAAPAEPASDQAQSPQPPSDAQDASPSEQAQAPQPPTPPAQPEVAMPSEEGAPSEAEMRDRLCADLERGVSCLLLDKRLSASLLSTRSPPGTAIPETASGRASCGRFS